MTAKFAHYRRIKGKPNVYLRRHQWKELGLEPDPRGGITSVSVDLGDGHVFTATAVCSKKDNYSKVLGRTIALGRALDRARKEGVLA